jgi:hypothetical protein
MGEHERRGAVDGQVAVQQAQRRGDHPRTEIVVERQRVAQRRQRIALGVASLGDRDGAELLACGAELVEVPVSKGRKPIDGRHRAERARPVVQSADLASGRRQDRGAPANALGAGSVTVRYTSTCLHRPAEIAIAAATRLPS